MNKEQKKIPPTPYDTSVTEEFQRVAGHHTETKRVEACTMTTIDVPQCIFHSAYTPSHKSESVDSKNIKVRRNELVKIILLVAFR